MKFDFHCPQSFNGIRSYSFIYILSVAAFMLQSKVVVYKCQYLFCGLKKKKKSMLTPGLDQADKE